MTHIEDMAKTHLVGSREEADMKYSSQHACVVRAKAANGSMIYGVEDWLAKAPPKDGARQWRDFRSAKELAQAWFRDVTSRMPAEYGHLLNMRSETRGFASELALAEVEIRIDNYSGPRNSDMVVFGKSEGKRVLLAVEAKATESFAKPIERELKNLDKGTNKKTRIEDLAKERKII